MKRFGVLLLCLLMCLLCACNSTNDEVGKILDISLPSGQAIVEVLEAGETVERFFTIMASDDAEGYFWDVEFVSEDENVATVQYERTEGEDRLFYTICAIAAGETQIYFQTKDGNVASSKITVKVTEKASTPDETEEPEIEIPEGDQLVYVTPSGTKYHYSKSCAGKNAIAARLSEVKETKSPCKTCVPKDEQGETTEPTPDTKPDDTTDVAEETTEPVADREVFVTPSGTKYHYSQSCGGKNATATTLSEAIANGKTPCKSCVPKDEQNGTVEPTPDTKSDDTTDVEEETTEPVADREVFVTPSGTRYHYSQSCGGKNATAITLSEAIADGKTPCKTCARD